MKVILSVFAFYVLMALYSLSGPAPAAAATDVNVITSSVTYGGVCVTTGTKIRVDTVRRGTNYSTIPSTRIGIELQNQDATYSIWCGYDTQFSTYGQAGSDVVTSSIGFRIGTDAIRYVGLLRGAQYHCQAANAAGTSCVFVHVEQFHKE